MALVLNEDEIMLRDSAEGFFKDKAPIKGLRELRDNRDETGFDRALWSEMADMGFAGIVVDEDHGGVDMGFMAAGLVAEQMGRNLSASPFFSTARPVSPSDEIFTLVHKRGVAPEYWDVQVAPESEET